MRHFKKRTLALVLASVVTVVGAFGAENYKNSLMNLSFESTTSGINMNIETKIPYLGNVSPVKKDSTTYVLMLPEMDNNASTPDLSSVSGNIESVNIRTMPYTNNAKGYTRITIKMYNPSLLLSGQNKLYIETKKEVITTDVVSDSNNDIQNNSYKKRQNNNQYRYSNKTTQNYKKRYQQQNRQNNIREEEEPSQLQNDNNFESKAEETVTYKESLLSDNNNNTIKKQKDSTSPLLLWLFSILIVLCSIYFYSKAKTKIVEITGENFDIKNDDLNKTRKNKQQKIDKINTTINRLDKKYNTSTITSIKNSIKTQNNEDSDLNIVDLDELFKEKTKEDIDENLALEDFLSGFSYMDEESNPVESETSFDENFYNKVINNSNMKFSATEIKCIDKLISNEISDEIYQQIEKKSVHIEEKKTIDKQSRLEDFVTTYSISQNIKFKKEDIEALDKILDAELDSDFVADLRTDSERTKQMEKELRAFNEKLKKPSEIITMKVKNFLPDLSEALKNLGNKKIESNYKPDAVYYSEGYDVSILSVEDTLPDLATEIEKEDAYESKPHYNEIEYVDSSYSSDVPKLSLGEDFSIKLNPKKDEIIKKEEKPIVKNSSAQKLIQQINESKKEVKIKEEKKVLPNEKKEEKSNIPKPQYIIDNESLVVISSAKIDENKGFHLAKNNSGYTVLGYVNNEIVKLKTYDSLKSEQIQARLNKKNNNQSTSYIIKIGTVKFLADVLDNDIKYIMDL